MSASSHDSPASKVHTDAISVTDQRRSESLVETARLGAWPRGGVPVHIALIMDGNGRWATRRGQERTVGHAAGETAILAAIDTALETGVRFITLYAFSTENWNRPEAEVDFLMDFNQRLIEKHGLRYYQQGVRFRYQGARVAPIPQRVIDAMDRIEQLTADATALTLTFCFNYGGRREIIEACRKVVETGISPEMITETTFCNALQYPDTPDPDLIVRTAGERRLSNFLLWQAAYAELVFLEIPWPDFGAVHFHQLLATYRQRNRTYGTVAATRVPPTSLS